MLKKMLFALMFAIVATVTHAESDLKTVASKAYVDTQIETKQLKIPAANTPGVGAGETVMTYTATGNGQIGERGLYSDISSYDATTDGDKLITASALNATFTNLPTTPTTKLECANESDGCTLWTIVDQSAYGKSKNLFDINDLNIGSAPSDVVQYKAYAMPNGTYTMSTPDFPIVHNSTNIFFLTGNVSTGASTPSNGVYEGHSKTITVTDGYFTIGYRSGLTNPNNPKNYKFQIELGDTATSYEPY